MGLASERGPIVRFRCLGSRDDHEIGIRSKIVDNLVLDPYRFTRAVGIVRCTPEQRCDQGKVTHGRPAESERRVAALRRHQGARGRQLRGRARCDLRAGRAQRRRQDVAVQLHQRPLQADLRDRSRSTRPRCRARSPRRSSRSRAGAHVPASGPPAARDRARERPARRAHAAARRTGRVGAAAAAHGPLRDGACAPKRASCSSATASAGRPTCTPTSSRTACTRASSCAARCCRSRGCCCSTSRRPACRTPRSSNFIATIRRLRDRGRHHGRHRRAPHGAHRGAHRPGRRARPRRASSWRARPPRRSPTPASSRPTSARRPPMTLLELTEVTAFYGPVQVLEGVSLSVPDGGAVGILGANGAGKTTTLRAISGTVRAGGKIVFDGKDIRGMRPDQVAALGIAHVPEGRGTLAGLTVRENLRVGAYLRKDRKGIDADIDYCLDLFPNLKERIKSHGSALSGGEQQMLAVARAVMAKPRLLLLDEASLGLAPSTAKNVYQAIGRLRKESGIAMLVVEQNANLAFTLVDTATVLETGRNVLTGTSAELKGMDEIRRAYLGG